MKPKSRIYPFVLVTLFLFLIYKFFFVPIQASEFEVGTTVKINICGDDTVEGPEDCDGSNLNGSSCSSLGFASGSLSCDVSCSFVTSGCTSQTPQLSPASPANCSDVVPGSVPVLYSAISVNGNSIELFFTESKDPVDKYILEYGSKSGIYQWSATNIGGKGSNRYMVNSLSPDTIYYFRIRASNGCAVGYWSNEISAKTKGNVEINILQPIDIKLEQTKSETKYLVVENKKKDDQEGKGDVIIKVVDQNLKPVIGAKVKLLTRAQELVTNNSGTVRFENINYGNQKILISYDDFEGEQDVYFSRDFEEFNLTITVKEKRMLFAPEFVGLLGGGSFVVLILLFILIMRRRNQ